ncbi:MAG: beta-Ala-His dipeptidase, partial [Aliifodinibius sp.]|nr:beta-Ala-His dipeptidase [Fodinibius sp.]
MIIIKIGTFYEPLLQKEFSMTAALQGLKPEALWKHFDQISQIPRCSRDEERVRQYVLQVAERNGLEYKLDEVKSVTVKKPATTGLEKAPIVVLQSHLDMVCEKNKDTDHDFSKDPIELVTDGDWITANGTTLGSDNGIGVAAALAVMESKDVKHGPMEFLFTVDEETGLTGATQLGEDMLEGRILLNMDSEEDGAIYIGCAGGKDTEVFLKLDLEDVTTEFKPVRIRVGGLQGGHSGLQIHEGLGNAIKLLSRFLWKISTEHELRLAHIDGGSKHNAIPRECDAIVYLPADKIKSLNLAAEQYQKIYKDELKLVDPDVFVRVDEGGFDAPDMVFSESLHNRLLNMLYTMPHGVLAMSQAVPGLVETSTNLAVIKTNDDYVSVLTSQRSSVDSALADSVDMITAVGYLAEGQVEQGTGYPAWEPNPDSYTLKLAKTVYNELFNKKPEV